MKNKLTYIYILIFIIIATIPIVLSIIKYEESGKTIYTSVKITGNIKDFQTFLSEYKRINNIKNLVFNDSFILDKNNEELVDKVYSKGYSLGISLNLSSRDTTYFKDLKYLINKYNIQVLYFENTGSYDVNTFIYITNIIKDKGIMIGLLENSSQNGLQYHQLINNSEKLKGLSNRALFTYKKDISSLSQIDVSFRLLRSVVDRGIRLLVLEAQNQDDFSYCDNTFSYLGNELNQKGYTINENMKAIGTPVYTQSYTFLAVLFILLIVSYFLDLVGINIKKVIAILTIILIVIYIVKIINSNTALLLLVLIITIIIPFYSGIYLFESILNKKYTLFIEPLIYFINVFSINITAGIYISLLMGSFDFRIGFVTYKLAILSYILPLVTILFYIYKKVNYTVSDIRKALGSKKSAALVPLLILLLCIYLSRSGNYTLFPATNLELKTRMLLENLVPARPRIKEFLIGYPSILLYLKIDKSQNKNLSILLLLGATITGISITNTFCHAFTPINISIIRSITGLALGTIISLFIHIFIKLYHSKTL